VSRSIVSIISKNKLRYQSNRLKFLSKESSFDNGIEAWNATNPICVAWSAGGKPVCEQMDLRDENDACRWLLSRLQHLRAPTKYG
jgi:hypothetical protein